MWAGCCQGLWGALRHKPPQRNTLCVSEHWEVRLRKATLRGGRGKMPFKCLVLITKLSSRVSVFSPMVLAFCYAEIAAKMACYTEAQNTGCSIEKMLWQVYFYFDKSVVSLHQSSLCRGSTVHRIPMTHMESQFWCSVVSHSYLYPKQICALWMYSQFFWVLSFLGCYIFLVQYQEKCNSCTVLQIKSTPSPPKKNRQCQGLKIRTIVMNRSENGRGAPILAKISSNLQDSSKWAVQCEKGW